MTKGWNFFLTWGLGGVYWNFFIKKWKTYGSSPFCFFFLNQKKLNKNFFYRIGLITLQNIKFRIRVENNFLNVYFPPIYTISIRNKIRFVSKALAFWVFINLQFRAYNRFFTYSISKDVRIILKMEYSGVLML